MGRPPCCDKSNVKRGLWTAEEDAKILAYVSNHGIGNWTLVPKKAGLNRCGKSCRLRWTNYLRPDLKHDKFTPEEEELIVNLHKAIGSRWSIIANQLPGRTDNDVKNYWNTKLRKKLQKMGIDPVTHKPFSQIFSDFGNISGVSNTVNQMGSLNKSLNTSLMTESDHQSSSPVLTTTGPSSFSKPMEEQVQDYNSTVTYPTSWGFYCKTTQLPHFFNEVSTSCSSSSSSSTITFTQSCSSQQSQTPLTTPTCSFIWSEFLLSDPVSSAHDFQHQQEHDFDEMLSPTKSNSSTMTMAQNDISSCNLTSCVSDDRCLNRSAGHEDFGSTYHHRAVNNGHEANNNIAARDHEACSSSASSFVDGILDKDREMHSRFPQLLDPCFDYY